MRRVTKLAKNLIPRPGIAIAARFNVGPRCFQSRSRQFGVYLSLSGTSYPVPTFEGSRHSPDEMVRQFRRADEWRTLLRKQAHAGVLVQREMELVLIVAIPFEWNLKQKQVNDPERPVLLGFFAWGQSRREGVRRSVNRRSPSVLALTRRSGCFPAEPYPPVR
jgi:hypothetical protein